MPPPLREPIELELRAFVAAAGRTRALLTTAYVGTPGAERVALSQTPELDRELDQALRTDLVVRALDGLDGLDGLEDGPEPGAPVCAWVTRGGSLDRHDVDAAWFAAAREGFARHGRPLPHFYVVNRTGWRDLVGGVTRTWSRVRIR